MTEEPKKITVELTLEEHTMITAILMMHHTGLVLPIHESRRPALSEIAHKFSLENIQEKYAKPNINP